ncbi:hypothetical protein P5673_028382 [Acropora cervicornis]|uniref:Uncharacterized protein n=1 Tax=Acropora cervicornis TaxID=6130 RepID=A0AAD9UUX5_ACRCE|nr:hypothetical protein P5673_028382 [Acropora cervicornis]
MDIDVCTVEQLSDEKSEDNDNLSVYADRMELKELLIAHLNINSIQNKFEDIIETTLAQIMFIAKVT